MINDIEQLIQAVNEQPGSKAFALLASRHLAGGDTDKALLVCARGVSLNPTYERGAVVYLQALRACSDMERAAEVYGRAIAENPRSTALRIAWANILLDAGREYEARLRVREAAELDPEDPEAQALLASLGGSVNIGRRTTAGLTADSFGPSAAGASLRNKVADLRPRLKLSASENRFDFSAIPTGDAPPIEFDPSTPLLDDLTDVCDLQPADHLEPADAFPGGETPAPELLDLVDEVEPLRPPDIEDASGSDLFDLPPQAAPETLPVDTLATTLPMLDVESTANDLGDTATRPLGQRHSKNLFTLKRDVATDPGPSTTPAPAPIAAPVRRKRSLLPLILSGIAAVILIIGPVSGVFLYRKWKNQGLRDQLGTLLRRLRADKIDDWVAAQKRLCELADEKRASASLQVGCALISAQLQGRFAATTQPPQALARLARAKSVAPKHPWTVAAAFWIAKSPSARKAALDALAQVPPAKLDWHARFALCRGWPLLDRPRDVLKLLKEKTAGGRTAAATMSCGARLARLSGRISLAKRFVQVGLVTAPQHPGLRVQKAALALDPQGKTSIPTDALRRACLGRPDCLTQVSLLQARHLLAQGNVLGAQRVTKALGKVTRSKYPEVAWIQGLSHMGVGGDVRLALAAFEMDGTVIAKVSPSATLTWARALWLGGRSKEARRVLSRLRDLKPIAAPLKRAAATLNLELGRALDKPRISRALCPQALPTDRDRLLACIGVAADLRNTSRLKAWARRAPSNRARRYLTALQAAARVGAAGIERDLKSVIKQKAVDHFTAPILKLLAQAKMHQRLYGDATVILRRVVFLDGGSVRSRLGLIRSLIAEGDRSQVLNELKIVASLNPTDPAAFATRGRALFFLGQGAQARKLIAKGLALHPRSRTLLWAAGEFELRRGRLKRAQKLMATALKTDPKNIRGLLLAGEVAARRGRTGSARRYFGVARRLHPDVWEGQLQVSLAYGRAGQSSLAWKYGKHAIDGLYRRKRPRRAMDAILALAPLLRVGPPGAVQHAADLLFQACKRRDAPMEAFYQFGLVYQRQKSPERAIWSFTQALRRDPKHAPSLLQLGRTLWLKARWRSKARRTFKRYLKLAPSGKDAARVRRILAQ